MSEDGVPPGEPLILAIDPDTRCSGVALLRGDKVLSVGVVDIRALGLRGPKAASKMAGMLNLHVSRLGAVDVTVVEGQQVYVKGKADANGLLMVAMASGGALGAAELVSKWVYCPRPREWKGQQPKGVSQSHILDAVGWKYRFDGPKRPPHVKQIPEEVKVFKKIPDKHMKEVVDAIGLGLWGYKKWKSRNPAGHTPSL